MIFVARQSEEHGAQARGVPHPLRACLYERRDGTFAGTGRWPGSRHAYVSIVFITCCLYGGGTFFVPSRLGGIPVSATGIPA